MAKGLDALVIAAGPPKMKGGSGGGDDMESPAGAKVRAARRMRQALERKDDAAVAEAYREMYRICKAHESEGEGDENPGDDGEDSGEEY